MHRVRVAGPPRPGAKSGPTTMVADPYPGYGLRNNWGVMGWAFGKLIFAEKVTGETRVTKPRALRLSQTSVQALVGFGFPARFAEFGTEDTRPQPFLGPAALNVATSGDVQRVLRSAFRGTVR
jgi:hypothetical protein